MLYVVQSSPVHLSCNTSTEALCHCEPNLVSCCRYGKALLVHFEDFSSRNSYRLLAKYREQVLHLLRCYHTDACNHQHL